jgi:Ala-tRNA(Pro) deacylase
VLNERAKHLLEENHVGYETFPHREAFTAQGVAAASHVSGWRMAKVLVVRPDDGPPVMVVLPASCRLQTAALARLLGSRQVSLVPEAEVERLFPDCEAGAMPPFGRLYGLPVYVDACFSMSEEMVFQAGNHREAVRMSYADFEHLAGPVVGEFCRH